MARNTIWEGLWEDIEGDTVTVKIPRDLAETLIAALTAGLDSSDMDMDGGGFALDLDPGFDDDMGDEIPGTGDADGGMVLLHGDGDDDSDDDSDSDDDAPDFGGDDDDSDDEDDDDEDDEKPAPKKKDKEKDESFVAESKRRSPFKALTRQIRAKSATTARKK